MSNLVKINSVEHLTAVIKAIVPRSFEKTFGGLSTSEVVAGFSFCVAGFSQTELNAGLAKINQMGYCPDPALFAKWCKGIDGFDNADHIADSYIGKNGALSNILAWIADPTTQISVAEKMAYDKCYLLFNDVKHQPSLLAVAHNAFKDHYEMVVSELVAQRTPCQRYIAPVAITETQTAKHQRADAQTIARLAKEYGMERFDMANLNNPSNKINKMASVA